MIKHLHGIDGLRKATQFLNSGQTTVMAFDAPLFALAKFAQWKWPGPHGEDKFIETFMVPHLLLLQILISPEGWGYRQLMRTPGFHCKAQCQ